MTDKVLCPWCGNKMVFTNGWIVYDGGKEKQVGYDCYYECEKCGAKSPHVNVYSGESPLQAALRRYEPPIRPMTLEEIKEHRERKDANPMWIEWKLTPEKNGWILSRTMNVLTITFNNLLWRCWPRKPTDEERKEAKWGDN